MIVGALAEIVIARAFGCAADLSSVIAARAEFRKYDPHVTILHSGADSGHVHMVLDGNARAVALGVDGRMVFVDDYQSGDIFGEGCLVGASVMNEDVVAVDAVQTGQFTASVFVALIENYGSVALAVSRVLTQRLTRATRRMVEGATLSANGRIHAELLRQARQSPDMSIRPAPTFSEFALHVQSTRETVSRAINMLEKRGIVTRDGDGIHIVAPHRLEELIY
jgi:CRP/FNR family transcriptional regulator, cyclic AMP receptor protein